MIIESIHVQNFLCIRDETLPCEQLTALIGPNGSGKSSFLKALLLFYTPSAKYSQGDFYNEDTSKEIIITITFSDLTGNEKELFQKYIKGEKLTVEKVISWPSVKGSQKYHGSSLQNPDFDSFRSASGAPNLRTEYNKLREGKYSALPGYKKKEDAEIELQKWEESNPKQCSRRRDEGQFFGFKEVGEAHLERYTRFILIPAVRDASEDAVERKGTPLTEIMDLVVRRVLAQRKEIIELQGKTQEQYKQILDPTKLEELQKLEKDLSDMLSRYVPDAGVMLAWLTEDAIDIPMPKANIKLVEDEYPSSVNRSGHGLQRAFLLTMLQYLAVAQSPEQNEANKKQDEISAVSVKRSLQRIPNLIIGIEEPELYQHPNRIRHLAKVLFKLAMGRIPGVSERTQIIYSTHSPLFVDIKLFDKIRKLCKVREESNKPKQTKVIYANLHEVAKIIEEIDEKPKGTYTGSTLEARLHTIMTPRMNEGFFAEVAVLVEGEEDVAVILGVATVMEHDFESMDISVIPCMGKNNLDKPAAIFRKLGIPVYVVWDSDYKSERANPKDNHRLLRLFNQPIEDWPDKVTEHFACFKRKLSYTMRMEIGEQLYNDTLEECCESLCLNKQRFALKNPQVIQKIIKKAREEGKSSKTLESIISHIVALRNK